MKKFYATPSVEKISFRYRDQIVAASGESNVTGGGSIFESSEFGGCFDLGDVGEYLFNSWVGDCSWINRA